MYSSANSVYPMRRKAGKDAAGVINQPNLVIFGTAIPNHYYAALSERMLTNGLFARMMIFECGKRGKGQEPRFATMPESVLETAAWWENFRPGDGQPRRLVSDVQRSCRMTKPPRSLLVDARLQRRGGIRPSRGSERFGRHNRLGTSQRTNPQAGVAARDQSSVP